MSRKDNPYFSLHHGNKVLESQIVSEAPYALVAVQTLEYDGKILGQLTLPNPETGVSDVLLFMPERTREKEEGLEAKLEAVRTELQNLK